MSEETRLRMVRANRLFRARVHHKLSRHQVAAAMRLPEEEYERIEQGLVPVGDDFNTRAHWAIDCLAWRSRILTGRDWHWCPDWDGLPVDETTPERCSAPYCEQAQPGLMAWFNEEGPKVDPLVLRSVKADWVTAYAFLTLAVAALVVAIVLIFGGPRP